jgi:hypothetical protein
VENLLSSDLQSKNIKTAIYRIVVVLLAVSYGCENWSLTFWKEHRLRGAENRALRIFGPKRDEVTGEWRKLHNEGHNDLYSSPNIIRLMKSRRIIWAGLVALMEEGFIPGFGGESRGKEITWKNQA